MSFYILAVICGPVDPINVFDGVNPLALSGISVNLTKVIKSFISARDYSPPGVGVRSSSLWRTWSIISASRWIFRMNLVADSAHMSVQLAKFQTFLFVAVLYKKQYSRGPN